VGPPSAGEVVLVPFPFSDLTQVKLRPAVCLPHAGRGDWILCQVTSNPYGDPTAILIGSADFMTGGLRVTSFARPGKLFTASASLIVKSVGLMASTSFDQLLSAVATLFRPSGSDV